MSKRGRSAIGGRSDSALPWISAVLLLAVHSPNAAAAYSVADDLPGPPAHFTTIPSGSLVIPMDTTLQAVVPPFNMKAYGLVNDLLQNGIPVEWAIRAGKAKDGNDFTATAKRVAPGAIAAASLNFSGGPFIVHRDFALAAMVRVTAFGNSVAVYELTADATVDVRYQLTHKPRIAVSNVNTSIHTAIFVEAGIPAANYTVVDPATLTAASCYTSHSEPHTTVTTGIPNVKAFIQSGANYLAQCKASLTYENDPAGRFQTTLGIAIANEDEVFGYPNPDLSLSQYIGELEPKPGGSEQDWKLGSGSVFQPTTHVHAVNTGVTPATWAATASKLYNGPGGMVYYLGGHDYGNDLDLPEMNGRRIFLNFIFTPATRPEICGLSIDGVLRTISGSIYEDVNGDSGLGDAVGRPGVRVRLYRNVNDNDVVDAGDLFVSEGTTDATGAYSFQVSTISTGTKYLVAVDSKGVTPNVGFNVGSAQTDVWAEQTYGDDPATAALDVAARYGGRTATASDDFTASTTPASNNYQHIARVDVTAGNVTGVHFAFSFNVVVHLRGGDATDDDGAANRTIQGALRQFLQNANAIAGDNPMRFVPAVVTNASNGAPAWWRLDVTTSLPALSDGSTTIDGRAYSSTNGTTVLDNNPGLLGAGATVGVDGLTLSTVGRPELEIRNLRSTTILALGLDLQGSDESIRRIALYGFGNLTNNDSHSNLRIGASAARALVEESLLGAGASAFADPGAAARSGGDCIRSIGGDNGIARNNLIGFCAGSSIALQNTSSSWLIENNEIRGSAVGFGRLDGIGLQNGSASGTVRGNLMIDGDGTGIDLVATGGSHTIVNNTIRGNGIGLDPDAGGFTVEPAGIGVYGSANVIDRNVIQGNFGAGVQVAASASGNRITRNSVFVNGTITNRAGAGPNSQIGIDLLSGSDNQAAGTAPFVTLNDTGDADAGGNGLLNQPVLLSAVIAGPNLILRGFTGAGVTVETFVIDLDPSGFGEGKTFFLSAAEGSGADADPTTGSYGPGPVNGLAQGTDTTNRFSFWTPVPPGVVVGSQLTATATDGSSNTSEFSGRVSVIRWAVVKRGYLTDGTPLVDGAVLPKGTQVRFLLYLSNPASAVSDLGLDDVLDPAFAYVAGSIRYSVAANACIDLACTGAEEATILASAVAGTAGTDAVDPDPVSFVGGALRAGNQVEANGPLDVPAGKVVAVVFTVKMQ